MGQKYSERSWQGPHLLNHIERVRVSSKVAGGGDLSFNAFGIVRRAVMCSVAVTSQRIVRERAFHS